MDLAPVVLFVYNRAKHTRDTLNALAAADLSAETDLIIFSDAPKANATDQDIKKIDEVRSVIREKKWCRSVKIIEQEKNKGIANSIIEGVTMVVNQYGKIIVLEDDIVIQKGFLKYMNDALQLYKTNTSVMHISGYIYPYSTSIKLKEDTVFLKIYSCWGWATWQRAWEHFNPDINFHFDLLKTPEQIKKFDIEGHADCYLQIRQNKEGIIFTWAVKWYSSWLHAGGISLFPRNSLVKNIGNDATGIHSMATNVFDTDTADYIAVNKINVVENISVRRSIDKFYKRVYHHISFIQKIKNIMKKIVLYKYWKSF